MTPSKKAIEAAGEAYRNYWNQDPAAALWGDDSLAIAIASAYAIDVAPLEKRIKELEKQIIEWKEVKHDT